MTYFGHNAEDALETEMGGYVNFNTLNIYTCPGTGKQDVNELGCFVFNGGNVRCAIYKTDKTFIMQGSAEIAAPSTPAAWCTHTSFVDVAGDPITNPQLDGGTNYILAMTGDGTSKIKLLPTTEGNNQYIGSDYTGGFPSSLGASNPSTSQIDIRCGVTAAAAVQGMNPSLYRRLRK